MIVFEKPKALTDATLHYCPGCTHGIIHHVPLAIQLGIGGLGTHRKAGHFLETGKYVQSEAIHPKIQPEVQHFVDLLP